MASPAQDEKTAEARIAGQYVVQVSKPLPLAGGGVPAFAVADRIAGRGDLMALQVRASHPPRARTLAAFGSDVVQYVLTPLADGAVPGPGGEEAFFVVCQAPPGPSLAATMRPWTDLELTELLLGPAARALTALEKRGITHRAIRPDNIFRSATGSQVVLGQAWAMPPASLQPAIFEPPYSAVCLPSGRGDGTIADDVYALGVTMLVLALGRLPQQGMDDGSLIRRKLEVGSYNALTANERVPPGIAELIRAMLAEDPGQRPSPELLQDAASARARRVSTRPQRRSEYPLEVAGLQVYDARMLAYAIAADPAQGATMIRTGAIDRWVRRGLSDGQLAGGLDEALGRNNGDAADLKTIGDPLLVMRVIAQLDPLAPLCWRGIALWPDGLGPAIATAKAEDRTSATMLEELISAEAIRSWAAQHPEGAGGDELRHMARQWALWLRNRFGAHRLTYSLNPLLPCGSKLLAGRWVARLPELLPAMEAAAAKTENRPKLPIDHHIAAFIAARFNQNLDGELAALGNETAPDLLPVAQLRLLARLQIRLLLGPLPHLAQWLASSMKPALNTWHNRQLRTQMETRLMELAKAGVLTPMLELLENGPARQADQEGARVAATAIARLDKQLEDIETGRDRRSIQAARIGQEIAAGLGLAVLATTLVIAAIG